MLSLAAGTHLSPFALAGFSNGSLEALTARGAVRAAEPASATLDTTLHTLPTARGDGAKRQEFGEHRLDSATFNTAGQK